MSGAWSWPEDDMAAAGPEVPPPAAGSWSAEAAFPVPSAERWTVEGRRAVYESRWAGLDLVTVRPPGREPYEHHVVRLPSAVGVVVQDPVRGVLLLHRHRFITGTEGFEIPAGGVDPGESIEQAAARETHEETGWRIASATHFLTSNASDGATDQRFHFVHARVAGYTGPPEDSHEATSLHWVPVRQVPALLRAGRVPGVLSSVALLYALQFGHL